MFSRSPVLGKLMLGERLDKTMAVGFLGLLVLTVLAHGAVEPWSWVLAQFLIAGLLALWAVKAVVDGELTLMLPPVTFPLAAFLIVGLVQSIAWTGADGFRAGLSSDVEATRQATLGIAFLLLAFLIGVNSFGTRERLVLAAHVLTVFGVILAVFALVQHFTWDGRFYWVRETAREAFGPFANRAHFAGYMAMIVPIPLALVVARLRPEARLLYGFAAALMGTAAIVSASRGGTISLGLSLGLMAFVAHRRREREDAHRHFLQLAPVGLALAAMVAGVVWIGPDRPLDRFGAAVDRLIETGVPDVGRAAIWEGTANIVRAHPVMGAGIGAYATVYPTYTVEDTGLLVDYAHNDYIQILADAGIVGGLIAAWFFVLLVKTLARAVRSADRFSGAMGLAAATGIGAIAIHSVSDTHMQIPSNALLFLFLAGTASVIAAREETGR